MTLLHTISIATALALALPAQAQTAGARPATPRPSASAPTADHLSMMDTQMKAMREMHDKMMRARTPEERNALTAEHTKLMRDGMAMMGGMGAGGAGGMGGMKGMPGMGATPTDMATRQQMMEKRMEMMQSMMQMMMDRLPAAPSK